MERDLKHPQLWQITDSEETASTNGDLKILAQRGAPHGRVILAKRQTAGRGRLGRSFFSPDGTGLYLSVLLRPDCTAEDCGRITQTAAVAACRAAQKFCKDEVQIKWVNDLYRNGKKICGILTEGETDPVTGKLSYAVVGAGFNLCPPKEGFPAELREIAGTLQDSFDPNLRLRLAAEFLNELETLLLRPFSEILDEYRKKSLLTGKRVFSPTNAFHGTATVLGIDEDGGLILRLQDGTLRTLTYGEVSVRVCD